MELSIHLGENKLDLKADTLPDAQLKNVLDTFMRLVNTEDTTVSVETVERLRHSVERLEGVGNPVT